MANSTVTATPSAGKMTEIQGISEARESLVNGFDRKKDQVVAATDLDSVDLKSIGRSNRTGLGNEETFEFFSADVYADWKNNGSLLVVNHTSATKRVSQRLYALVNSYYLSGSTKVSEHTKYTDLGNIVKWGYVSPIAPDENGIIHDEAARRAVIEEGSNMEIAEMRTPSEILAYLAGKKITGQLSEQDYLQQRFEARRPVANEYVAQKVTIPVIG